DPRLDDNIIYNGTTFCKKVIITGTYPDDENNSLDNINYVGTSTRTGYYMRKFLREDVFAQTTSLSDQYHIYPRIRYTEIFLAYAEAANDAWGPKADPTGVGFTAYDVIKAIRGRAGLGTDEFGRPLPEGDAYLEECAGNQAKMTDLIRNERRIELCFENKRFWDIRRWKMPLNETVRGMQIDREDVNGEFIYTYSIIDVEDRKYDSSYQCYGPIPKGEVLKWSRLQQNKGWK
ncbi:MAG: RagB/SusD family nutrient uptake outer membrane protein, partial [Prevotella sp.]|nr:RagB/SusD family nutrient uptake outer membrane protein [Prevotella sp.]